MLRRFLRVFCLILACVFAGSRALYAQPRSTGVEISPFRNGLNYQHTADRRGVAAVHYIAAGVDITGPLMQRSAYPGYYLDYACDFNIVSAGWRDVVFNFLAGPGIDLGYAEDISTTKGLFVGPMADVRAEVVFRKVPVSFALMLKPTFAIHVYSDQPGERRMSIYKHGLMNSCIPQFSVSYFFDHKSATAASAPEKGEPRRYSRANPLYSFGVEYGYIAQHHIYSHFNYVADGGYRVNHEDVDITYTTNAQVLAHFGVNLGRHTNLAVYGGYQGITRKQRIFPMTLRFTGLFGQPDDKGRWLAYAGGGVGFKGSKQMFGNAVVGHIGGGYRLTLTRETKLDFLAAIQSTYWHPNTFSESIDVRRSNELLLGLNLGIGLTF